MYTHTHSDKKEAIFDFRFGFDIGTFPLPLDENISIYKFIYVDNSISVALSVFIRHLFSLQTISLFTKWSILYC